jgi:hypothetical protein
MVGVKFAKYLEAFTFKWNGVPARAIQVNKRIVVGA